MQKCYRKVPDTSPQASKKYIFVHQISIFLKKTVKTPEKKSRKKTKLSFSLKRSKMKVSAPKAPKKIWRGGMGQNFVATTPPPPLVSQHSKTRGGGLWLEIVLIHKETLGKMVHLRSWPSASCIGTLTKKYRMFVDSIWSYADFPPPQHSSIGVQAMWAIFGSCPGAGSPSPPHGWCGMNVMMIAMWYIMFPVGVGQDGRRRCSVFSQAEIWGAWEKTHWDLEFQ